MGNQERFVDFQVYARACGLAEGEQKRVNELLFSTYEQVRLWLKEHLIRAPFKKVVVSLADQVSSARWHGHVSNAIKICQVTEAVDLSTLRKNVNSHQWVLRIVSHALGCVAVSTGWRSEQLEDFIAAECDGSWPLMHFFDRLTQFDSVSGVKCVPWLSTRPGETQVGVRLVTKDNVEQDVTLLSRPEPVYLEDSFAIAKSAIKGDDFVLLDKAGKVLASVPFDRRALH